MASTDQTTEFKDHQETMFEDQTSFAIPEEDTSQEVNLDADPTEASTHDSLPEEAPDTVHNQVLFPEHASDSQPAAEPVPEPDPVPEPPPILVGAHQGTNPLPRTQFAPIQVGSEAPVLTDEEIAPPPPPVEATPIALPPPPVEEVAPPQPVAEAEPAPEAAPQETPAALTIDDFAALEERVLRAVSLVRREREARHAAEERLMHLESQTLAQVPVVEQLQQEVDALRAERDQVRQRVERLLSQLDALEL
jgi:uncharacterized coiled-coil protein SlyX